jgi:hypothetical protein
MRELRPLLEALSALGRWARDAFCLVPRRLRVLKGRRAASSAPTLSVGSRADRAQQLVAFADAPAQVGGTRAL